MDLETSKSSKLLAGSQLFGHRLDVLPPENEKKDYREFVCGYGAAFINICITFPINKVMFRQMAYGIRTNSALLQMKKEGISHLYRGLLPPLLQKTLSGKQWIKPSLSGLNSMASSLSMITRLKHRCYRRSFEIIDWLGRKASALWLYKH